MPVNLTTLFQRIGHIIGAANETFNLINGTVGARAVTVAADYQATIDQNLLDGLYTNRDSYRNAHSTYLTYWQTLMQNTIIQQVTDAYPYLNPATLTSALTKLIAQMVGTADSIQRPTITSTVTPTLTTGNGTLVVSLIDPVTGYPTDYAIPETLLATCTADGFASGGGTAGQETFSVVGQPSVQSLGWNWPQGSGASVTSAAQNASLNTGILNDGDFETWSTNTPTLWNDGVFTAGTTLFKGVTPLTGAANLKIVGNAAELTTIRQTLTGITPLTSYSFNCWANQSGAPATGTVRFRLVDGSNNVITNANAVANSFTQSIPGLTTSFAPVNGFFQTPAVLPPIVKLEIGLSVALTAASVLNIDRAGMLAGTRFYAGGPLFSIYGGSTNFAKKDYFTVAITNNKGIASFPIALDRFLGLRGLGITFPSANSPTLADALIV